MPASPAPERGTQIESAAGQSGVDASGGQRSWEVTCQPTHSPSWEERLYMELQELQAYRQGLPGCFPRDAACAEPQLSLSGAAALMLEYCSVTTGAIQEADVRNGAEGDGGGEAPPKGLWYSLQAGPQVQMQHNVCSPTPAELPCTVIPEPPAARHCCGLRVLQTELLKDGYDLPSHDALAQILPNGRYLFKGAKTELHRAAQQEQKRPAERPEAPQANRPNINHTYQIHHPRKRTPLHDFEDDPHMAEITDLQTKEVENYRSAMSKMAEDIIVLRTQVVTLDSENSQLRTDLSLQQDLGRDLLDDTDIDVMTKAEIADRIASLKLKLASEISKAASQRDRIQQLQNDLIKKNDSEKELLNLQRVHQQQQEDLRRHQSCLAKIATLEATVKQQEKVIEKMEKALDGKFIEKIKLSGDKRLGVKKQRGETDHRKEETELALAAENTRLRGDLDWIRQQPASLIIQQSAQTKETVPLKERLSLLNKLERAEARVQTLEAQLEENSKLWGRQKQEMLTKLSEHRHGFVRTSTTILHNVPSRSVSESLYQQSSQRKQKPVK